MQTFSESRRSGWNWWNWWSCWGEYCQQNVQTLGIQVWKNFVTLFEMQEIWHNISLLFYFVTLKYINNHFSVIYRVCIKKNLIKKKGWEKRCPLPVCAVNKIRYEQLCCLFIVVILKLITTDVLEKNIQKLTKRIMEAMSLNSMSEWNIMLLLFLKSDLTYFANIVLLYSSYINFHS